MRTKWSEYDRRFLISQPIRTLRRGLLLAWLLFVGFTKYDDRGASKNKYEGHSSTLARY